LGERSGAPSGVRPSSFVIFNTPVEVRFTSAGCLSYPCRTPVEQNDEAPRECVRDSNPEGRVFATKSAAVAR
jgi:hypothetical protein